MKRILVFGEGLGIGPLLVQLHADGIDAVTANSADRARAALADSQFDAVLGPREDFAPGAALADCGGSRRVAVVSRSQAGQAKEVLGQYIDDCVLMPVQSEELVLAIHRKSALRTASRPSADDQPVIGIEGGLREAWARLEKAAAFEADALICGESGTGKELFARAIHRKSKRADGPFVAINCAAIPSGLLESHLFGHVRGAFTDAHSDRVGVFAKASGGTLFLDEVGELQPEVQVKLLRVLQMREVQPVGASETVPIDVRVVSATSRNLVVQRSEGLFRDDLYYRLAVVTLEVPSLRERGQDLGPLIDHFLGRFADKHSRPALRLSPQARSLLMLGSWPGNVRELENTLERLVVLAEEGVISQELVEREVRTAGSPSPGTRTDKRAALGLHGRPLKEAMHAVEALFLAEALHLCEGKRAKCAALLDISQRALLYKIKEHNL